MRARVGRSTIPPAWRRGMLTFPRSGMLGVLNVKEGTIVTPRTSSFGDENEKSFHRRMIPFRAFITPLASASAPPRTPLTAAFQTFIRESLISPITFPRTRLRPSNIPITLSRSLPTIPMMASPAADQSPRRRAPSALVIPPMMSQAAPMTFTMMLTRPPMIPEILSQWSWTYPTMAEPIVKMMNPSS